MTHGGLRGVAAVLACGISVALAGCSAELSELRTENATLKERLGQVSGERLEIVSRYEECQRLTGILSREKLAKEEDLARLRGVYREHIASQYQALGGLLRNEELLDYFGGELVAREKDQGNNVTLVFQRPVPENGRVLRVRADVAQKTRFRLLVFKPLEKELLCVHASEPLDIDDVGSAAETVELPVPVHVQKGDVVGFYFPEKVGVRYDEQTGNFSVYKEEGKVGLRIGVGKADSEKRNYSLGVLTALE
jgi:hypothetical protein